MKYTYEMLKKDLLENLRTVTFTKIDGTERTMKCTLNSKYIPDEGKAVVIKKDEPDSANTPTVLPVWEVDLKSWRAFRIDSVKGVS